jgi:hypothetical protein
MTKDEIELALKRGLLAARMANGNAWQLRRNGQTQTWKTRPSEFRIPVKAGLKSYGAITERSVITLSSDDRTYIVEQM